MAVLAGACKDQSLPAAEATQLPSERTEEIATGRRTAITSAVERVAPSVVTVQTEVVERVPADVFEQFFGGRSGTRSAAGLGSGFIVREDGVILTNAHVVSGASRISVAMRDGTTYPAKLVGIDESNDLAVIKIDAKGLPNSPHLFDAIAHSGTPGVRCAHSTRRSAHFFCHLSISAGLGPSRVGSFARRAIYLLRFALSSASVF